MNRPRVGHIVLLASLAASTSCFAQAVDQLPERIVTTKNQVPLSDDLALKILAQAEGARATGQGGWGNSFDLLARRHAERGEYEKAFDLWRAIAEAPSECVVLGHVLTHVNDVREQIANRMVSGQVSVSSETSSGSAFGEAYLAFGTTLLSLPSELGCELSRARALAAMAGQLAQTDVALATRCVQRALQHLSPDGRAATGIDPTGAHEGALREQLSGLFSTQGMWVDALSEFERAVVLLTPTENDLSDHLRAILTRSRSIHRLTLLLRAGDARAQAALDTWLLEVRDRESNLTWTDRSDEVALVGKTLEVVGQRNTWIDATLHLLDEPDAFTEANRKQAVSMLSQLQGADTYGRVDAAVYAYDRLISWASPEERTTLQEARDRLVQR